MLFIIKGRDYVYLLPAVASLTPIPVPHLWEGLWNYLFLNEWKYFYNAICSPTFTLVCLFKLLRLIKLVYQEFLVNSIYFKKHFRYIQWGNSSKKTYNFKHSDFVQLQGFLGRLADSDEIMLCRQQKRHTF